MAWSDHALSRGDLHWAAVCHLRITARVDSVGNSVPLLGPLIRNANSFDEQMWLPLLRNVRRAVVSKICDYIYPTLARALFVVGTEATADGWLWSGNWSDFHWWQVPLLFNCAGVWSSIGWVCTVFTLKYNVWMQVFHVGLQLKIFFICIGHPVFSWISLLKVKKKK